MFQPPNLPEVFAQFSPQEFRSKHRSLHCFGCVGASNSPHQGQGIGSADKRRDGAPENFQRRIMGTTSHTLHRHPDNQGNQGGFRPQGIGSDFWLRKPESAESCWEDLVEASG